MTPQEKAAELIVNYQLQCKSLDYQQAKQCALIAVDEILKEFENIFLIFTDKNSPRLIYWQQVKQEIEKS